METISRTQIIEIYVEQYREYSLGRKKNHFREPHYMRKINAKANSLRRAVASATQQNVITKAHTEVGYLAFCTYFYRNKDAIRKLNREVIPELVRLDLELFEKDEWKQLPEHFWTLITKEQKGSVCKRTLLEIYREFKSRELREKMLTLVPSRPELEFEETRQQKRHFILHVGPTNSGKTYQALLRLKDAKSGVYLGPLRLLALEVYEKMKEYGTPCTMLTGQECIEEPDSRITASTIEMLDIQKKYDVAVIDEAQMISDSLRGHSWTRAVLGVQAKEIHICMSPVAQKVIEHLILLCKDTFEVHTYERKTKLEFETTPFVFPDDVQDGDALIVFSKKSVLNIAGRLETSDIPCSVIYGSLPPEIRRRQISQFASGETKVVVSTDAIGMGLNLPVRRIVFLEIEKFDGTGTRALTIGEIKQIAGRAGRFGKYETGYINGMGDAYLRFLQKQMAQEEAEITKVSLGFPQVLLGLEGALDTILTVWHSTVPAEPFEKINIEDMLFLYKEAYKRRAVIAGFEDKSILYRMITCPIDIKDREVVNQWNDYCMNYVADVSLAKPKKSHRYQGLLRYESYYKKLDLYYQFSVRLGKEMDLQWLEQQRENTQDHIMRLLAKGKNEYILRCKYCGRVLPLDSPSRLCRQCRKSYYFT